MNKVELLEGVGLSKGEVKTYFALLELGPSTTGEIINKANVSRSKVYEMLERLIKRGLVSYVIKENTKYFEAAKPNAILKYVEKKKQDLIQKEKELKKILPDLEEKQKLARTPQSSTVYEGIKGVKTFYNEILTTLKKGEEYYAIAVEPEIYRDESFKVFIENYHNKRAEKGINVKLLAHKEIKKDISKSIAQSKLMKNRFFTQSIPSAILIYKDNVATFVWSKTTPTAIVMRSSIIAQRYRKFFEEVWNSSVK